MTLTDLLTRTYQILEQDALFYEPAEVTDALNTASFLLCAMKPQILVKRTAVTLEANACFLDLRIHAPRKLPLHSMRRVVLGNVTGDIPVTSQGYLDDLHPATLESLASHRSWMTARKDRPYVFYRHTDCWVCTWPMAVVPHTVTLVYSAKPVDLPYAPEQLSTHSEVPEAWCDVLPELASAMLLLKESGLQASRAVQRLANVLGVEQLEPMRRAVASAERRTMMLAGEPDGAA